MGRHSHSEDELGCSCIVALSLWCLITTGIGYLILKYKYDAFNNPKAAGVDATTHYMFDMYRQLKYIGIASFQVEMRRVPPASAWVDDLIQARQQDFMEAFF